ncbi:AbfB domain-containing protein [Streptomyces sp. NPDC055186]
MPPSDWFASIQSVNFPDRLIRHRDFLGFVDRLDNAHSLEARDFDFTIGPGLADERLFSIQASNFPNHYLRHQDFRLKLQEFKQGDELFAQDATFELTPALAYTRDDVAPAGISLRSFNIRDHFVRHSNFELWLAKYEDAEFFQKDASFHVIKHSFQEIH